MTRGRRKTANKHVFRRHDLLFDIARHRLCVFPGSMRGAAENSKCVAISLGSECARFQAASALPSSGDNRAC